MNFLKRQSCSTVAVNGWTKSAQISSKSPNLCSKDEQKSQGF